MITELQTERLRSYKLSLCWGYCTKKVSAFSSTQEPNYLVGGGTRQKPLYYYLVRSSVSLLCLFIAYEIFGDLNGIECSALADLVTNAPKGDATGIGEVFADSAHIDIVFA